MTPNIRSHRVVQRRATFEDYGQIARLAAAHGLQTKAFEEWSNLWLGNPVYQAYPDWPMGWVLEDEHKEIVGHMGNVPLAYELQGETLIAATGHALVVDPRYRSHSITLFSEFFNQEIPDLILNTSVNAAGAALHELFRCARVPVGQWDRAAFWIADARNFAAVYANMKRLPLPGVCGWLLSAALSTTDACRPRGARSEHDGLRITFEPGFDDRFDRFWKDLRGRRSDVLQPVRSRATLEWHLKFALAQKRAWIIAVQNDVQLLAYSVFVRQDNEFGLKRMRLADFQSLDGAPDLLVPMISLALQQCVAEGIHTLEMLGLSPEQERAIAPLAPRYRDLPCWLYFYYAKDKELREMLKRPSLWAPSLFDGDASL